MNGLSAGTTIDDGARHSMRFEEFAGRLNIQRIVPITEEPPSIDSAGENVERQLELTAQDFRLEEHRRLRIAGDDAFEIQFESTLNNTRVTRLLFILHRNDTWLTVDISARSTDFNHVSNRLRDAILSAQWQTA